ncbi:MAG: hypothetical protein M3036_10050 [Bifidobacteriales bacterium]|nr:hypothetical protein [Bifidobacteriales bacterium]
MLAAESFDPAIIDHAYTPFDNCNLQVILKADGSIKTRLIASVASADPLGEDPKPLHDLRMVFRNPSLQTVTTTIAEKGCVLVDSRGLPLPWIAAESEGGSDAPSQSLQPFCWNATRLAPSPWLWSALTTSRKTGSDSGKPSDGWPTRMMKVTTC